MARTYLHAVSVSGNPIEISDKSFYRVTGLENEFEDVNPALGETRVIILNQDGDVFTGFDNPVTKNPIFREAGEIDAFNKDEALLKERGMTLFYANLDEFTKGAFENCVFVRIAIGNQNLPINTRTIMGGNPTVLSLVADSDPENNTHPSISIQRRGVFFNNNTERLHGPLNIFKKKAHEFFMGLKDTPRTGTKRRPS